MNINKYLRRVMAPAGDGDAGGASDRGDNFAPPDDAVATAAAETAAAETAAAETAAAEAAAAEQARDAGGKFTKKDKDESGQLIPKPRFDEAIGKERQRAEAAERRAAELEAAAAKNAQTLDIQKSIADVAELRKQERKALLDGNDAKAAEVSMQADALNRKIAIAESGAMTAEAKEQALEDMRFDLTLERMEEKYAQLVPGSETYDQDLVDDILDKQRGLIERLHLPPSKALAQAVEHVMRRVAPAPAAGADDADADGKGAAAGLAAAKADERKSAAVAKNLAAAAAQPGSLKDAGLDSDKAGQTKPLPSVNDMTYEEFNALPEATRAKMRGDFS